MTPEQITAELDDLRSGCWKLLHEVRDNQLAYEQLAVEAGKTAKHLEEILGRLMAMKDKLDGSDDTANWWRGGPSDDGG